MDDLHTLLQNIVNADYHELLYCARECLNDVQEYFNSVGRQIDATGAHIGLAVFGTCLAADGKFTDLEYRFVNDLFGGGVDYSDALALVRSNSDDDSVDFVKAVVDNCPSSIRGSLLTLCACFLAVDERISKEETTFIRYLLS